VLVSRLLYARIIAADIKALGTHSGPPGTEKSYLAKAVATEVESTVLSISSKLAATSCLSGMGRASGESGSWVTKPQTNMIRFARTLFGMDREYKPLIILIDELDALGATALAQDQTSTLFE